MTKRDAMWRAIGAALFVTSCVWAAAMEGSALIVLLLPLALAGLTLMINGKRVVTALRAERRGHIHTAAAIHSQRMRRQRNR